MKCLQNHQINTKFIKTQQRIFETQVYIRTETVIELYAKTDLKLKAKLI